MSNRIKLGRSRLEVSPICYGSWQLSPKYWGDIPAEQIIGAVHRAFEVGVNFFDTADAYGDGLAEEVMGEALATLPRDRVVLATKLYWHFYDDGRRHPDLSGKYVIEECENSLRRLKTDYIDLYQLHAFDPLTPLDETTEAMEKLRKAGKVRFYGTSNFTVEQMRLAKRFGDYSTDQPQYSLLDRQIESDVLPYCEAEDIGVLVFSPLSRGLLTGKYDGSETFTDFRSNAPRFTGQKFKDLAAAVQSLAPIAEKYGLSIVQLVLAATLAHPAVHCAIVGIKTAAQIEEAAGAMGKTIGREDYFAIRNAVHE
ncbi:MAG: aldo/keto reductase [Planctomycetota bacterium]|nr:aldo/keto reductase [Planctomycetota bacterium]